MSRKLAILFSALLLAAFGVAACGGDDDDDEGTDTAATEETTTEEQTTEDETTGGGAGGGSTVSFTADPGGELAFLEDSAEAEAGTATIELTNESTTPHDVRIENGGEVGGTDVITGDTTTAEVELEPGEYTFYCSVPGHREAGMEGPLTVN